MTTKIVATVLSSGYWHIRGEGPCNWAQVPIWPCGEDLLRANIHPEASEEFIRAAIDAALAPPQAGEVEECATRLEAMAEGYSAEAGKFFRQCARLLRATQSNGHSPVGDESPRQNAKGAEGCHDAPNASGESPAQSSAAPTQPAAPVQEPVRYTMWSTSDGYVNPRADPEGAWVLYAAPSAPAQEPTITVSGPVACGKSYVMELIYKALRNAGLHPYSDELAHERRMVEEQPQPAAKVWRLRESVYAAPPQAAPAQKPVAWAWFHRGQVNFDGSDALRELDDLKATPIPLYAAPPPDEARELMQLLVQRYDDYRGKGISSAPGWYQMVVDAIERIRAFLKDRT